MMILSKNNRWPFAILALAYIAYFSGWAYINQHAHIRAEWSIWRCTLLLGGIYLVSVFFTARRKSFNGKIILAALGIPSYWACWVYLLDHRCLASPRVKR